MKNLIFSVSLFLSFEALAAQAAGFFSEGDAQYLRPDSVIAEHLAVKGMKVTGFDEASLKKLNRAFEVLELVVNSEEFKDRVVNFKNKKGERKFASNRDLTNEEVYQKFMEGRETLQQDTPSEMNFYLRLYYRCWSRVVGYTSGSTNTININWKYFRKYGPHEVAGNLAHEWVHKLGFDHRSAKEHDSVPYAIGYIVEELAAKYATSRPQTVAQR